MAKPDVLRLAHAKASKEVTHLLYHRIRLSADAHLAPIIVELSSPLRKFLGLVPADRLQPGLRERIESMLPPVTAILSAHAASVASSSLVTLDQLKAS